jgi:molybdate transport system substrate-binding protein
MKTWLYSLLLLISSFGQAGEFRLAAASNLQPAITALSKDFSQKTGLTFQTSFGASGKLFAQISIGAPFDVFMSVDLKYPQELVKTGAAIEPVIHYANDALRLWTAQSSIPKFKVSAQQQPFDTSTP